ncbi:Kiwa anti-phage protein KwaB-like domain-containing protein [Paenibacillus popilliae]|uniref:Permease component n=1 Tax=Paenibacillus popilliae ATCC 14706 TaxID=1212764 RepID=M9M6F3_PAEPP|nr:Kiwa anti-phage protein KwaB-like domain-containing protein [Paenibacillus popilliae]GAC43083.1 permease component [Paenibacillus popilliae ATCC 14706]
MDINGIITMLDRVRLENVDLRLYFTRKQSNDTYISYSPTISTDLQADLISIVTNALKEVRETEQRPFNPIGTVDGCVEYCDVKEIMNFQEILNSIREDVVIRRRIATEEIRKLTFYCLKIVLEDQDELMIFRRVTKFNRLTKGLIGRFIEGDFEKLNPDLLGIDGNVDVVIFRDEMLVLNHISLERIFSIKDQYIEKASYTLEIVGRSRRIQNFEQFREDCLADGRIIRALTKILDDEERIHKCFINFENVLEVVDIFELDIKFEEGNTVLVYEEKSQLLDITRLIRDSFYRSLINNREGIDEGV